MLKVLVQSSTVENAARIKKSVEKDMPYEVVMSFNSRDTEDMLTSKAIHAFVLDSDKFTAADFQLLREFRSLGFTQPIVVIARSEETSTFLSYAAKNKIHFLERPFEHKALIGVARKIISQRSLHQQMHRRFRTNQYADVETFSSGDTYSSQMFNLSKGGAYCEFTERPTNLTVGDLVRVRVQLADVSRDYCVSARVVWITREGVYSGGFGAGVKFIKSSDVYRQLMENS